MISLQTLEPNEVAIIMPRIKDEIAARYTYEAAVAFCNSNGYEKASKYFANESTQENEHYKKWIQFLSDWNVKIEFPIIDTPPVFDSFIEILEFAYMMEYALLESYESDAVKMFPLCQAAYKLIQEYVQIQNDAVIEYNNLLTKAYNYMDIDPKLVLFESENFD